MTFRLEYHNKIVTILEGLDTDILLKGCAYFGGGTLLSLDFDFISPVGKAGYSYLRKQMFG